MLNRHFFVPYSLNIPPTWREGNMHKDSDWCFLSSSVDSGVGMPPSPPAAASALHCNKCVFNYSEANLSPKWMIMITLYEKSIWREEPEESGRDSGVCVLRAVTWLQMCVWVWRVKRMNLQVSRSFILLWSNITGAWQTKLGSDGNEGFRVWTEASEAVRPALQSRV